MPTSKPDSETQETLSLAARGWAATLTFWGCLLIAAAMYAAVSLAPKMLTWATLKREQYEHQVKLVTLERQVTYLRRVVDAMENDPEFASQLARIDFDAARPGDERITVDPQLSLDAREIPVLVDATPRHVSLLIPLLRQLTDRPELRRALLAASAALAIFAFTFLHDPGSQTATDASEVQRSNPVFNDFFASRYLRPPPPNDDDSDEERE